MLSALRDSRSRQRQLVQDAGHELRTPITSIRTNVDVLRRHGDLDPDERMQVLDDVNEELTQVSGLVEELVVLASGDIEDDQVGPVQVDELVRRLVERARRRLGREITVDAEPWRVEGSVRGIERAVDNLLSNAGKFSGPEAPIEVSLRGGRLSVRDRGPGIAEEDLSLVFQRFYRATAARTQPGSGLGLAMVDQIARAHGGEPFAQNHPDGGAVVGFTLPQSVADRSGDTEGAG
jgi:two-component system sensor histidine kinase MprB